MTLGGSLYVGDPSHGCCIIPQLDMPCQIEYSKGFLSPPKCSIECFRVLQNSPESSRVLQMLQGALVGSGVLQDALVGLRVLQGASECSTVAIGLPSEY